MTVRKSKADESPANHRVKGRIPLSIATKLGDVGITRLLLAARSGSVTSNPEKWAVRLRQ